MNGLMRAGWLTLTLALGLPGTSLAAPDAALTPFSAEYSVRYASFKVGDSRFELKRGSSPTDWIFESRADATGLARLFASGALVQTSWMKVDGTNVRPQRFSFNDGMQKSDEDISLDFDWAAGRVSGTAKGKPVDAATTAGLQDPGSIQIATMLALLSGRQPGAIPMIDGAKIKVYDYILVRRERLDTPAGSFDTVVYTSQGRGSQRIATMWLAPELDFMPVQLEQHRKGKRTFGMYLKKYRALE